MANILDKVFVVIVTFIFYSIATILIGLVIGLIVGISWAAFAFHPIVGIITAVMFLVLFLMALRDRCYIA